MFEKSVEDGVVIFRLKNGKTNPVTGDLLKAMHETVLEVSREEALKGLVLTGSGRFFTSGFDLPTFINFKDLDEAAAFFTEEEAFLTDLFGCRKPVVCAMNGHAAALGLILAMASDYRVVKDHPKIRLGMSEIRIGLPLTVAMNEVMRFGLSDNRTFRDVMFFGEMLDVERARAMHVVDEVLPEDRLLPRAKEVIKAWIDTPGRPFIAMKQMQKRQALERIRAGLSDTGWVRGLACLFKKEVKAALEAVQATLP